ncbi:MAG: choice-of-anchor E domain-containing protein [Chroococcidiopsidaceae cyanobacterium CP_BM_ER_R8_30]|nr:choice-of-anchor E domain-containing protein [Chroococcidiopsidaceae cyanobacterium CP_BM_ER_R8_30]
MIKQVKRINKRKWLLPTATLVSVLSASSAAKAATLSYSAAFPPQNSSTPTVLADGTTYDATTNPNFGPIPKFDPSLGTLQSVAIDLSGTVQGDLTYTNKSRTKAANINAALSATVDLNAEDSNGTLLAEVIPSSPMSLSVPPSGSGSVTFTPATNSVSNTYTDGSILSFFTGPSGSSVGLGLTPTSSSSFSGTGNFNVGFDTFASATATITYNYSASPVTAVPEPSNILGISSFGGVGLLMIKKGQKQLA